MKWSNEPVFMSAIVAGLLIAISSALFLLDQGASYVLAAGTAIGQFGVVLGGGVIGRSQAYGPKTVDTSIDAEAVIFPGPDPSRRLEYFPRVAAMARQYRHDRIGQLCVLRDVRSHAHIDDRIGATHGSRDCGRSPSPPGPRVTVGMMDVALGSASAVSAVELDLLGRRS